MLDWVPEVDLCLLWGECIVILLVGLFYDSQLWIIRLEELFKSIFLLQHFDEVFFDISFASFELVQVDVKQWRNPGYDELDLLFAKFYRLVISWKLYKPFVSESIVVFWYKNVCTRQLVQFSDPLTIISDDERSDSVWNWDEGVWSRKRVYFKLLF